MVKKVSYICDRCGEEFEDYDRGYRLSKDTGERFGEHKWQFVDMCPKCENAFVEFFRRTRGLEETIETCEECGNCTDEPAEEFEVAETDTDAKLIWTGRYKIWAQDR